MWCLSFFGFMIAFTQGLNKRHTVYKMSDFHSRVNSLLTSFYPNTTIHMAIHSVWVTLLFVVMAGVGCSHGMWVIVSFGCLLRFTIAPRKRNPTIHSANNGLFSFYILKTI